MDRVALYARVSTDNQDIQPQTNKLEEWAEYQDVDYQLFTDDGVSAVADTRPGFKSMMDSIERFDAVVFTKLDRFGRTVNDLTTWAHELKEMDVDIVMTDQPVDTSDEYGELLFNILSVIADFERKITRERMEAGYREALAEGRVGRKKIDIDLDALEQKYNNGASVSYLANYFDVSRDTIYNRLHEIGLMGDKGAMEGVIEENQ